MSSTLTELSGNKSAVTAAVVTDLARDIGTLLHSHCTKLSLAARPPITPKAINACIIDIQKLFPMIASLCHSLQPKLHGKALCDRIRNQSRYALIGVRSMVQAVSEDPVSEARLNKTGILWESCLELQNMQKLDLIMSLKVKECTQMIGDAVDDLKSWSLGEEDDNFDDFETSDSESDAGKRDEPASEERTADAEIARRISMLTRIQLFLKAVDKRQITPAASTQLMNGIYDNLSKLSVEVDDLAGEIQESADTAFIMEMEKIVIQRVEELLSITLANNRDEKWQTWVANFRKRWLEEVIGGSK
ncbi:Putative uncharacterized protein [Taphrina deformans PYCC 5710]|uniref:Cyclin-D1-binding protein 1-like N-terminal domain-containing protein n=1 Tax=Taphrina deformans (strain PYCC 5710 / ATCC 11124 / CBS 356.35 / IMI 108563 / JCM 9778 / NBRC 8474) TaxID=1097556 RepID=R4XBW3_TAPDE|nr:Putative uncharacterized protein [Taphrina deformans PYCC 5710]|eukprot:CCG83362.1 Putative uncharacterized protein [Taphrina deformans PYCC 5710]